MTLQLLILHLSQLGGGMGWGFWATIGGVFTGLFGIFSAIIAGFIAWRRDRDLKQLDQQQKNRDDAISILRTQLAEQSTRHEREMVALGLKVDHLEKQLSARSLEWAETNKQLNDRTLELAAARVEIGRLGLQRDESRRQTKKQAELHQHFRDFALLAKETQPAAYALIAEEFKRRRATPASPQTEPTQ